MKSYFGLPQSTPHGLFCVIFPIYSCEILLVLRKLKFYLRAEHHDLPAIKIPLEFSTHLSLSETGWFDDLFHAVRKIYPLEVKIYFDSKGVCERLQKDADSESEFSFSFIEVFTWTVIPTWHAWDSEVWNTIFSQSRPSVWKRFYKENNANV